MEWPMAFDKTAAEDAFQNFLILMDDQIEWLEDQGSQNGINLNLSDEIGILDRIENLYDILSLNLSKDDLNGLNVIFARFAGEWVRKHYGGAWVLPLDNPKNVNFNVPVIEGHSRFEGVQFAPISVMRSYSLRRKPGTLRRAVEADVKHSPLNLDHLLEGE